MSYQNLKNTIDLYNSKAHDYKTLLQEFDFQGFLKASAQVDILITHHAFSKTNPLPTAEANTARLYKQIGQFMASNIASCFSDKFPVDDLEMFLDAYESIPEKYHQFCHLNLSKEELLICHKVLDASTLYRLYGKEKLTSYKDEYMTALLAKSLPLMSEDELQNLIGTNVLTEKQFLSFKQNNLFPENMDLTYLHEAFGLPMEKVVTYKKIKSVGTTFKTKETDTPRQELLDELHKRGLEGERDTLQLIPYIYTDDKKSCNAVMVRWGKEDIANLSQAFVDTAYNTFDNPTFTITDYEVTGGYSQRASYGLTLDIKISGIEKTETQAETETAFVQSANPMNI